MVYTFAPLIDKLIISKSFSPDADTAEQKQITNEALEAIITSGRWDGTEVEIQVRVAGDGLLTLARELVTCKGVRVDGNVRNMASIWYNYLSGTSELSQFSTNIQDHGDRWPVFKDMRPSSTQPAPIGPFGTMFESSPPEPAQLRVVCPSDNGATVEVHGLDTNGVDIYTGTQHGELLTVGAAIPAVNAGPYFSRITEVILPITDEPATLYACYDDNTQEAIGYYAPGETNPNYRRYLVQEALTNVVAPGTQTIVNALCQRRHIDLVADNDVCAISNFKAIRHAVRSIHWQNEGDPTRQNEEFNDAIKILNQEFRRLKPPSELGAMRVNAPWSTASGLFSRR
jgi:hypothetical protein